MFYQEITLIDQMEIPHNAIWSQMYKKLHIALVEFKKQEGGVHIGVSFPGYVYDAESRQEIGSKLRLIAKSERELEALNIRKWLSRLGDYLHVSSIKSVPSEINGYASYGRKQNFNSSYIKRLQRRAISRNNGEESRAHVTYCDLPFIQLESYSTSSGESGDRHGFNLYIQKKAVEANDKFTFSTYGLSSESAVPEF